MQESMSKETETADRTLVARAQKGDETAFAELVRKYSGRAYQIAYGVLGNRQDAEEIAEDTFIKIHRALPDFRGDAAFTTWMYRIAMNLARNKYQWNKTRAAGRHVSIDAPLEGTEEDDDRRLDLPDTALPPDEKAAYNELDKDLNAQLEQLPEVYREPLVMHNIQDMSYEEIAELLKCKLGTVKSRIARARDELRKRLGL